MLTEFKTCMKAKSGLWALKERVFKKDGLSSGIILKIWESRDQDLSFPLSIPKFIPGFSHVKELLEFLLKHEKKDDITREVSRNIQILLVHIFKFIKTWKLFTCYRKMSSRQIFNIWSSEAFSEACWYSLRVGIFMNIL